jgi:squalene-associated FAD-dependent desaturase
MVDNGSHLMLSANSETRRLLGITGGWSAVREVRPATFAFHDLRNGASFTLRPNDGPLPWWIFSPHRRAPGSTALDHLAALWRLFRAPAGATVADTLSGPLYDRVWHPLAEAVMNTAPHEACAASFRSVVRDSLLKGERACRPWLFPQGLDAALVAPTVAWLEARGARVLTTTPIKSLDIGNGRVTALQTRHDNVPLNHEDCVVSALPAHALKRLAPELVPADMTWRAILNVHFRLPSPLRLPPPGFLGLVGGKAHWVFLRDDVLSVTVSVADDLAAQSDDLIAESLWADLRHIPAIAAIGNRVPLHRVVRERRATLAHLPGIDAQRPMARTEQDNLMLAGDWTATGYPCTVEGAVRSGVRAARLVIQGKTLHGSVE